MRTLLLFALLFVSVASIGNFASGAISPANLRCEALVDPAGIDVAQPRLSWIVESPERAQRQSAYQVLVASRADLLAQEKGDLWDSGKVESDQTTDLVYAGKPLAAHQECFWKVKVWDGAGQASQWSKPARFSVGLLEPSQFKGQWIGLDKHRAVEGNDANFEGAKWIAFAKDKPLNAPKGPRVYMKDFTLPAGVTVEKAELLITGDDSCRAVINADHNIATNGYDKPAMSVVTEMVKPGANTIRAQVDNGSPGPTGLLAKLTIKTSDGKTTTIVTDETWRCTDNPGANWHNRQIAPDAWPAAIAIAEYGAKPWGKLKLTPMVLPPPIHLRGSFTTDKPVKRAVVYTTALGIHDLYLDGSRVSEDWFNPGWTDYTKRVYYRAYDVTAQVRGGQKAHVLGAILADGWYSGYVGYGHKRDHYGSKPRFAAMLRIEYQDGSVGEVVTGPGWKASTGPTTEADFLMGETYDARKELADRDRPDFKGDWSSPGFDDSKWDKVDVGAELKPVVQWHPGYPVEWFEEITPVGTTQPKPGVYVVHMGQNFAGVVQLKVTGEPGQKIVLRFAERLNPDGTIYTTNLREARVVDTYICKGRGEETWRPRFTFHGFQYVEITGIKSPPPPGMITGVALSSATPVAGSFNCSDPMLNRLHKNILWTQRMNFIDIPTDCPQRDERLGWTGDAQVYIRTATLNTDVQAFFTKWLVDLVDAQRDDGQFPMVAPLKVAGPDGGAAWADAGTICPWTVYEVYGDRRVLERAYPAMKKFVEFCRKRSTPELLPPKQYHCFGDWLSIKADTPKDILVTAYFAQSARLTARAAEVLGKPEEARQYTDLYEKIKSSFNKAYVKEDGKIGLVDAKGKFQGDTQTCYVLAIAFDLLDDARLKLAARHLVDNISERGWHLSTGFIGTKDLMLVLAKIGRNDVAYRLLHNDTFPSWGFSIKHGATSIWERWDGWTPDKGFQTPSMNSFAHYSFGAVYQWMVENIGGISSDGVGYKRIAIAPRPGGKLTHATVSYDSIRGRIQTSWLLSDQKLGLSVTIPANTTAKVVIPTNDPAGVREVARSPKPLAEAEGVKLIGPVEGGVMIEVGSGTYTFTSTCTPVPLAK